MLNRPHPRVRVISWSRQMKLKRRHEVQIAEGPWCYGPEVPIARFATRVEADVFANVLRLALPNKGRGIQ